MWYVYIIRCRGGSLYTGTTTDIPRRVIEHNRKKGGAYTRTRLPVKLIYKESCRTRSEALKREFEIKNRTHDRKLDLISKK